MKEIVTTARPVKKNGYTQAKANAKRDRKRREAEERQFNYEKLNVIERIALAKSRPGESKREIARLTKLLNGEGKKTVTQIQPVVKVPATAKPATKKPSKQKKSKKVIKAEAKKVEVKEAIVA